MNFEFNDEQRMVRDEVRRVLAEKCPSPVVREVLDDDAVAMHESLWRQICDLGWPGTAIPESLGGLGLGHLELCLICEELGRALAPLPFSSSACLASEALLTHGSQSQRQAWLPRLAKGSAIGTLVADNSRRHGSMRLHQSRLSGTCLPVIDGLVADVVILCPGDPDGTGAIPCLVDLSQPGVTRTRLPGLDPSKPLARLDFDAVEAEPLGCAGAADLRETLNRGAVLMAFEQLGGAAAALDSAVEYAKERRAFGRPIGSFQAVKHMLADMYVSVELARSNCYFGAWALSSGDAQLPLAAAAARTAATQAYRHCARNNIQTHGGMGFTWEFDCHIHYRRAQFLALALGSERRWKAQLIEALQRPALAAAA